MDSMFVKIQYDELLKIIYEILILHKLESEKAEKVAVVIADSTIDGVNSHGINRLPLLIEYIENGYVSVNSAPEVLNERGSFCQVDGKHGVGILNALYCTDKAIEIASENGIGLVALKNTNHWLRAGTYGWKAADKGFILIAWTNTVPNLPPYGSENNLIGNNPLLIAIPRKEGHLVLDMSMSQYSYGTIAGYARQNKKLQEFGGYDKDGNLTKDAVSIRNGGRHIPIGFWKGSGLSIVLDLMAAVLSGGKTTYELGKAGEADTEMSQVFIAIDPVKFGDEKFRQNLINETLENFNRVSSEKPGSVRYPGQGTLERRNNNLKNGIFIEKVIWEKVINLKGNYE